MLDSGRQINQSPTISLEDFDYGSWRQKHQMAILGRLKLSSAAIQAGNDDLQK
jgi:hypothetical protein